MEKFLHLSTKHALAVLLFASLPAYAQQTAPAAPQPAPPQQQAAPEAAQPHGEVLFQSHGEPPASPQDTSPQDMTPAQPNTVHGTHKSQQPTGPALTDKERAAILFTAYDLDARLTPASSRLSMRAQLTLRNIGSEPLSRIALQISSTLHWQSVSLIPNQHASLIPGPKAAPIKLSLAQHLLDTDADHTGKANEAILTLPQPLDPGESLSLDTFYAGPIALNAGRLERIGATPGQALAADWDSIGNSNSASSSSNSSAVDSGHATSGLDAALRGFGDVLWYPVAEPQLFLGDGAVLFHAIDRTRLREQDASIHLRIAVEYKGDPPVAVYFCGRRQPLVALPDDADSPVATGAGIATAEFSTEPIGFRLPSLFVVENPESLIAPLPGSGTQPAASAAAIGPQLLAVETSDNGALPRLAQSAQSVAPLLQQWFGPRPLTALTILDHDGQPFQDGPLLVAPIDSLASSSANGALANSLTHAWVQTGEPWMDEGLAEFISLLWTEQQKGREAANAQLNELIQPLNLVEPDFSASSASTTPSFTQSGTELTTPSPTESGAPSSPTVSSSAKVGFGDEPVGQPLISASSELYYRRKAAAVWWMLRDIAGDDPLREALSAWRTQPVSHVDAQAQAEAFEKLLEKTSGKDLGWFFDDWVLRDRGLPDLSIVDVTPRLLPAGQGHDTGWLVAVTVHNAGAAAAEVPVVVRSGDLSIAKRMRIPGLSDATERVVIEAPPTEVLVNDGSVPEVRASTHRLSIVPKTQ
jgi:hypothetical protein